MAYSWFILSMILFFVEAFGVPGVGALFAALSALCIGLFVQQNILSESDLIMQGAAFFGLTGVWAAALWKPMKKFHLAKPSQHHHDMIGRIAIAAEGGLEKGRLGKAKWSGTTMTARLADDASIDIASDGVELKIIGMDGSTLLLAEASYTLKK